jgi:hypothetical protein
VYLIGSYTFPHEITTGGSAKPRPVIVLQDELENRNPCQAIVAVWCGADTFKALPYRSQKKRTHSGAISIARSSYPPVSGLGQINAYSPRTTSNRV